MRLFNVFVHTVAMLLAVLAVGCAGIAVRTDVAPWFDWYFKMTPQHVLVVHNGPVAPICPSPPPDMDCVRRNPEPPVLYVGYISAKEYRLLVYMESAHLKQRGSQDG